MFLVICFIAVIFGTEAVPNDIVDFFPVAKGNLTKITWAHAVNSQNLLESALNSGVMMLEADVQVGKLNADDKEVIPIMAHPPSNVSDLPLLEFIQKVRRFNSDPKQSWRRKGIKLDFKSIEAFEAAVPILKKNYLQIDFPLWINADILPGPQDATTKPVDPKRFLPPCKLFDKATVSIGWTTRYLQGVKIKYTLEQVEDIFDVIRHHAILQPITVPVRAAFVPESFLELKELLFVLPPGTTLTIWHGKDDHVDTEQLNMVINSLGVGRVFIDLPREILNELHLDI